jgi:hypothetical protein
MHQQRLSRSTRTLWILGLVSVIYLALVYFLHSLTGNRVLDGSIGVLLGLYVCSRPAGNAVDMLFAERGAMHRLVSERSGIWWLVLNLLVLLAGWLVIVAGAIRFAGTAT